MKDKVSAAAERRPANTGGARSRRKQGPQPDAAVATADPTEYNVEAIAKLEREALHERSLAERVSDRMTSFTGSISFLGLQVLLFVAWVLINLNFIPGIAAFAPFPFGTLTLIVSAEGVFLAIFILISQNRMTRQADRRAHLDLQVSMLAKQELTMMLRMQQRLSEYLGLDVKTIKDEAQRLVEATDVQKLVSELEEKFT